MEMPQHATAKPFVSITPPRLAPSSTSLIDDAAPQTVSKIQTQKTSSCLTLCNEEDAGAQYAVSEESKKAQESNELALQRFLMARRAKALVVPTKDAVVRSMLRSLDHPITLIGEEEMDRRERLRALMAKLDEDGKLEGVLSSLHAMGAAGASAAESAGTEEDEEMETIQTAPFYTEGSRELLVARVEIARYSLPRAAARLAAMKKKMEISKEDEDAESDVVLRRVSEMSMSCCEVGDRPLLGCAFSRDGTLLATCGLSDLTKVWNVEKNMETRALLRGHTERVTSVAFSPTHELVATASADRTAILWNIEGSMVKTFQGHLDCLARLAFHPSGAYLGTTSYDQTWRLWDVNTGIELLLQEGHSRSVYGISFQGDGALVASCGMDALARVWDLRSGRSILALEGHVKPVLGIDFSPNGYHLATGSDDHTCRVWDLRKRQTLYTIPAHTSLISQVKYEPSNGYVLATASHDNTCRMWSGRDFKLINTLDGDKENFSGIDLTKDGEIMASVSVSHSKTIKLWSK